MTARRRFGRFAEPALWIMVALSAGPRSASRLLDDVRTLDGFIGPGTLYAAVARLEQVRLIERVVNRDERPAYRLTDRGTIPTASLERGSDA